MLASTAPSPALGSTSSFDRLNPQQRAAAMHASDRPLLVIAGAGSGKTNTLAHRVAHLLAQGEDPRGILLLTFSRRAAAEMTRRVERIAGAAGGERASTSIAAHIWAGTFHAIGARLLREFAPRIGLADAFTIHDREDAADLMNLVRHEAGLSATERRFPQKGTCLAIYSRVVNTEEPLHRVLATLFPWCAVWEEPLRALFSAYVEAKQAQNVLDYDDLLLYWAEMMREPAIAADLGERFRHVLVDEYQDTNKLQASILLGLKPAGAGLTVVGDDAQSIYAFRGATVRNILDFPQHFTPPASVVLLEQNYRSTPPILDAANAVMDLAKERFTKNLFSTRAAGARPALVTIADEAAQARCVVDDILARREEGVPLRQQSVLFRTSHHSMQLELELTRRGVPFVKFGGLKFLEASHVKDVLACLRWAQNPRDRVAGFRVLLLLPRVGPKTAARTLDELAAAANPYTALDDCTARQQAGDDWAPLGDLVRRIGSPQSEWPAGFTAARRWYEPLMELKHDDAPLRAADLAALEQIASTYASCERFLTELTLDPPSATSDLPADPSHNDDYLILSTIHSAKGQEWRAVHVLNVVDGCIPSDLATGSPAELEEERRLLYVAMTRAKDHLALMVPQRFYVHQQANDGDRHVYANRTRFIPGWLEKHFEARVWPLVTTPLAAAASTAPRVDLAARMRAAWRA